MYLITDFMGHGHDVVTMLNNLATQHNTIYNVVLFSYADDREKFEQDINNGWRVLVESIRPRNLSFSKANWEDREDLLKFGVDLRKDLLAGKWGEKWAIMMDGRMPWAEHEDDPQFPELSKEQGYKMLLIPHKMITDGKSGVDANSQSLPLSVFTGLNGIPGVAVLGQHFHKINDVDQVNEAKGQFKNPYIPGEKEHPELYGIRGVPHHKYRHLLGQMDICVGVLSTWVWEIINHHPEIPVIALMNKGVPEKKRELDQACLIAQRSNLVFIEFDEETNMEELANAVLSSAKRLLGM